MRGDVSAAGLKYHRAQIFRDRPPAVRGSGGGARTGLLARANALAVRLLSCLLRLKPHANRTSSLFGFRDAVTRLDDLETLGEMLVDRKVEELSSRGIDQLYL